MTAALRMPGQARAWPIFPLLPQNMGTGVIFVHAWTYFSFLPRNTGTGVIFVHL